MSCYRASVSRGDFLGRRGLTIVSLGPTSIEKCACGSNEYRFCRLNVRLCLCTMMNISCWLTAETCVKRSHSYRARARIEGFPYDGDRPPSIDTTGPILALPRPVVYRMKAVMRNEPKAARSAHYVGRNQPARRRPGTCQIPGALQHVPSSHLYLVCTSHYLL